MASSAGSACLAQQLRDGKGNSCRGIRCAVSAGATLACVMAIAEVIKNVGAIAIFAVTKLDHLAQLAPLKRGATFDIARRDAQLRRSNGVQHQDAASATERFGASR